MGECSQFVREGARAYQEWESRMKNMFEPQWMNAGRWVTRCVNPNGTWAHSFPESSLEIIERFNEHFRSEDRVGEDICLQYLMVIKFAALYVRGNPSAEYVADLKEKISLGLERMRAKIKELDHHEARRSGETLVNCEQVLAELPITEE